MVVLATEGSLDTELKFPHHGIAIPFFDAIVLIYAYPGLDVLVESNVKKGRSAQLPYEDYGKKGCSPDFIGVHLPEPMAHSLIFSGFRF